MVTLTIVEITVNTLSNTSEREEPRARLHAYLRWYDQNMDYGVVRAALEEFVRSRDWEQFHTQRNLASSISIESAELLECFQWSENANETDVEEELADILTYCFLLANKLGVDPGEIVLKKLKITEQKYPVSKSKGQSTKYDRL